MTSWKRPRALMLVAIVLIALLPLLAGLQYHWLGQLSENERERMRNNLTAGVARFSEDFDRELTRIYSTFQQVKPFDSTSTAAAGNIAADVEQFSENMARWWNSPRAELIKDVYIVEDLLGRSGPRLRRFDAMLKSLDAVDWSEELLPLKERIGEYLRRADMAVGPVEYAMPSLLFQDVPLVVIPRMTVHKIVKAKEGFWEKAISLENARASGSLVVAVLDRVYIEEHFLPDLTAKYFSDGNKVEYNIAIVSRKNPKKFLYVSDSSLPRDVFSEPDATQDIFGLRMDNLVFVHSKALLTETYHAKVQDEFVAGAVAGRPVNLSVNREWFHETPGDTFMLERQPLESEWQLAVKHRAGSLEKAVGNARLRNLGMSFGILFFLGISVLTMLVTTHRAQRLAGQQMTFVAGVSHELRTPLAVIRSAGENLADGLIDDVEQSRKYGTIIRNEGRRLSEMVEKILDFAGIQAQRRNYELRPTDASAIVKAALDESAGLLESAGFQVATEIPAGSVQVLADPAALKSALQNLVSNAVKYSNGCKWIGLILEHQGESVAVRVIDRGIGIPPSELPHIFEPFYRGREVMDAQIQGSGLGLSLVKHVVEGHKGAITVDSSPQHGSVFTVKLPAMDA